MLFSNKPNRKKIEAHVFAEINNSLLDVGLPRDSSFEAAFQSMINRLGNWAKQERLGDWKRSIMMGVIEEYFRITCKRVMNRQQMDYYVKSARQKILYWIYCIFKLPYKHINALPESIIYYFIIKGISSTHHKVFNR